MQSIRPHRGYRLNGRRDAQAQSGRSEQGLHVMPLITERHGKRRVRIARVARDGIHNEIRELVVEAMLEGNFAASYTMGDNSGVVATDTIKNIANIVGREHLDACPERYAQALAQRLLDRYEQVTRTHIVCHEIKWSRATIGGLPHPHAFTLDANGRPLAEVIATREGMRTISGIAGYTFMKTTQSGWVGFVRDEATTLPETTDRIAATSIDARWNWRAEPADYPAANATVLSTMLEIFATTYSRGIQDSLYRMGEAALAAVPELEAIAMACPNKHYVGVDLTPFGLSSDNLLFTPTDEPHGQIECTVGR